METKDRLRTDLASAMRSGEAARRDTLRLILAAIKQAEVDGGEALDEQAVQAVLAQQAKQRRESIEQYQQSGRTDLAEVETIELAVIMEYLPQQMSEEEIRALAAEAISETGVADMKGMGQVMQALMPRVQGRADGRHVSAVVRQLLQQS